MSKKDNSSLHSSHTSGSGEGGHFSHERKPHSVQDTFKGLDSLSNLKTSDSCSYNDSGVWSGSNIHSEEINTPESPISKTDSSSFVTDKVACDNKSFMRLDSGIDVSVSKQFSELSLEVEDSYNNLNDPPSKSKDSCLGSLSNINKQFVNNQLSDDTNAILRIQDAGLAQDDDKVHNPTITSDDTSALQRIQLLKACFEQNEDGDTDLHLAIYHKFIETVYALVRMVPHPDFLNIKNNDRQTPLHVAVLTRQPRLARLLVCAGAAPDVLDCCGNTALHIAVAADDLECVLAIINPVSNQETVSAQLQYRPYHSYIHRDIANIHNYDGQACVHLAANNENIEILHRLVWIGADINAKEWKGGQTCLHLAVERRNPQLCHFLVVDAKINAELLSYAGQSAYQTAGQMWDATIMKALEDYGVDTYLSSDEESDDDMSEGSFGGYQVNGGGLVNVGA
ncbi:NF-kappa-B inhibitor cactus-like [Macrosteles quadrilineatus]|uniref:NF-kappa-B inhibitor cactus-like n=1 Tax=Macrosteles quadrilineatus TaxID=74068 RepID=UPI0023E17EE1|nr:NF-kappa-B inhibitor cactus-like [Macrosteles quadrilineatus]